MKKNLVFCSASFHIPSYAHDVRENEYHICLFQMLRMIPNNYDIVVCDNTVTCVQDLQCEKLRQIFTSNPNIQILFLERNIGTHNIGMGELDELIYTSTQIDFTKYDKIVYFTLRKIMTNPYLFEKVNAISKDALVSNPGFLFFEKNNTFTYKHSIPNLFNDMFFAMSSPLMLQYIEYSRAHIAYNLKNNIGSEQNLHHFIKYYHIDCEFLESLGLIRIDYKKEHQIQLI